ncbi:MAG: 23S rRNA (pseudouridine(1915)-N(3))-methyltransferase RlmH [Parvibaculales bacterium]
MRIEIRMIGTSKGHEFALFEDYRTRTQKMGKKVGLKEITLSQLSEKKKLTGEKRKTAEATLLQKNTDKTATKIALTEKGEALTSQAFAQKMAHWLQAQNPLTFFIGGADGLDTTLIKNADFRLSLSPLTFPHRLVLPILAEQIWRSISILQNHPYHRE